MCGWKGDNADSGGRLLDPPRCRALVSILGGNHADSGGMLPDPPRCIVIVLYIV